MAGPESTGAPKPRNREEAEKQVFDTAKGNRERYGAEPRWDGFLNAYLKLANAEPSSFVSSKKKPEFEPLKDRYRLRAVASGSPQSYDPAAPYARRVMATTELETGHEIYIDAPLAYAVLFQTSTGEWETIARIAFVPDFEHDVLLVDQVQGGDSELTFGSTEEGKRARDVFKGKTPEIFLFNLARELAEETGMRGIGLRKGKASAWSEVKKAARAATRKKNPGKPPLYDRIARENEMRGFAHEEYNLIPVRKKR